ncbi:MAG: zinc-dependent metalloprotease family protein [Thermodesulfobacteriota bacterium]
MDLFDTRFRVVIDKNTVNRLGTRTIRGRLDAFPAGFFTLSVTGNKSLGFMRIPEKNREYRIRYEPEAQALFMEKIDPAKKDRVKKSPPLLPGKRASASFAIDDGAPAAHGFPVQLYGNIYEEASEAVIAVMVVYTPAAKFEAAKEGGIENIIALAVEETQLALDNSDTQTTLSLVHADEVDYEESGSSSTDLRRLQGIDDGYMDGVHRWRDRYGADLVALLASVDDVGGISYQLGRATGDPEYAFSLTRVQQASTTYTFAHEIGHNLGMGHHKEQLPESEADGGLFEYSAGWRWWGPDGKLYSSIMTYPQEEYFADEIESTNVPHFSNPDIYYEGKPTGDFQDGDNARTLRAVRHVIAAYRADAPQAPAILKFTAQPASFDLGETVTLEWGVKNADEVYIGSDTGTDIGYVGLSGERTVAPEEDTTYTLTASNAYGEDAESLSITVDPSSDEEDDLPVSRDSDGGCFIDVLTTP